MNRHQHTFRGQTLVHEHPHNAPHGYYGHDEDPKPHDPSPTTGTYVVLPFTQEVKWMGAWGEWRPECTCGWVGSYWPEFQESSAKTEAEKHALAEHDDEEC